MGRQTSGVAPGQSGCQVFVGTFTNASGETVPTDFGTRGPAAVSRGIYSFRFDPVTGRSGPVQLAAEVTNPVNLIIHPSGRFLYACRGQGSRVGAQSPITAYLIAPGGSLRELNTVASGGLGPTVGVIDPAGLHLLTTNWITSSIVCVRLHPDGRLGEQTALVGRPGETDQPPPPAVGPGSPGDPGDSGDSGDSVARPAAGIGDSATRPSTHIGGTAARLPAGVGGAPGAHVSADEVASGHTKPHAVVLSHSGRFAIVAEINSNRCQVLRFDARAGTLHPHMLAPAPPGSGPRHLALRPGHCHLYTADEEGAFLSAWGWDDTTGSLRHLQRVSTVPAGVPVDGEHPADVQVHPNGRFVYVTNRRVGTIAGYRIDGTTGLVSPIGHTDIGSPASWSLAFDRTGRWAFATALLADEVRIHAVDPRTGVLAHHHSVPVTLPTCVRIID